MKKTLIFLALLMVMTTTQGWAKCCPLGQRIDEKSQSNSYPEKLLGLTLDGVYRIVESPFELLYYPYNDIVNQKKYATGLFTGLGKGVYYAGENIVVAVANIISAPVPGAKGYINVPNHVLCGSKAEVAS